MNTESMYTPGNTMLGEVIMAKQMLRTFKGSSVWVGFSDIEWTLGKREKIVDVCFDYLRKAEIHRFVLRGYRDTNPYTIPR